MASQSRNELERVLRTQHTGPSELVSVCLIGNPYRREFEAIHDLLKTDPQIQILRRYDRISEAVAEPDVVVQAQLTIVLQSWPEQYARRDIHQLIGITHASRLVCFCGPWCESEGRNHNCWPDAIRTPAREVLTTLQTCCRQILTNDDAPPVTASRDEVFALRVPSDPTGFVQQKTSEINAAIVGPDRSLNRTVASLLKSLGVRTAVRGLVSVVPYQVITPVQTPRGSIHVVFQDLDPFSTLVQQSLEGCRDMFPDATIVGLANMPDAGLQDEIADADLDAVLAKSNLLADLQLYLQDTLAAA